MKRALKVNHKPEVPKFVFFLREMMLHGNVLVDTVLDLQCRLCKGSPRCEVRVQGLSSSNCLISISIYKA